MRRLAVILALLLVAVLAGTAHVHTQDTADRERSYVESLVQRLLSAEGRPVDVEGIGIGVTGNVTARRVAVRDARGEWLVIEDFGLNWSPLSIFTSTLRVNALTAGRVTVLRSPEAPPPAEAPEEAANLIAAEIGTLTIDVLDIAGAVPGRRARLRVSGSGSISQAPPAVRLDLAATRIDDVDGSLVANILFEHQTNELSLDLVLTEGQGGLVQRLLALADDPMIDLRLVGRGPMSDWSGDLNLALNAVSVITGTARLTGSDAGTMIEAQLAGDFARLAPPDFGPLLDGHSELAAAVMLEDGGFLRIESATLRSDVMDVTADGVLDFEASDLLVSLTGRLAYAGPVRIGAADILRLAFEARLQGQSDAPEWEFNATAESLEAAGMVGRNLTLEISGNGLPLAADRRAEARIVAFGVFDRGSGSELPPLLDGQFLTDLSFELPGDGRVVLESAYYESTTGALSASGHFTPADGEYELALDAQTRSPQTGIPALDRLLEGPTRLAGRVTGMFPEVVRLHDVVLSSQVLDGRLSGQLSGDDIELAASAVLSELGRLDARAVGAVEVEASLTGSRLAPHAEVAGRGRQVSLMGKPFRDVTFAASGSLDPDQLTGEMRLTGNLDGRTVDIAASLGEGADGAAPSVILAATVGTARIQGALVIPTEAAPHGRLTVQAPDLSHLGPLLLSELGGRLEAEIEIADHQDRSTAVIKAQGSDITYGALAAAGVDADITVEDVFGTPRPRGDMRLTEVRAGALELAAVSLETETAGPRAFAIALEATGPRMRLAARTTTVIEDGVFVVTIEQLSGRLDDADLTLAAPAALRLADEVIGIERAEFATGGGRLVLAGTFAPRLDATIELSDLPLAMAAKFMPDLAPRGTVSGTATLSGTLEAPQARFKLTGSNVAFAALSEYRLPPLALEAEGDFAEQHVTFTSTARAPRTELTIAGTVALSAPHNVAVTVHGPVPSALAGDLLAEAGLRLDAVLDVDLRLTGPLDTVAITGAITTSDATFGDVEGRLIVQRASGRVVLGDGVARIERLQGATGRDGRAAISGTVALAAPHQADLRVELEGGHYSDGTLLVTTFDANLTVTGPLAGTPRLAGRVDLIGPRLTLNEPLTVALAALDVNHLNAPGAVQRQAASMAARRASRGGSLALEVEIVVRDRFMVRGRGLDAELGGRLTLTGTLSNPTAVGGFLVRRGRLDLLGQRIEIERGQLDFVGDLDPRITFAAVARREGFEIELLVSGRATAPEITITSSPMLPQEEALSRLIFGTSLTQLSPFQIAQLAAAVATLSGGGGGGLMDGLGQAIGLDRFEIIQTETGETRVSAGRQITERVSLGVEQGREPGSTRVNIDIEISDRMKLRGSLGRDGSSKAGVFFQTDY